MLKAITDAKLDAVVGYTQRFRRKWLSAKEKVRTGALGDVTLVTSRAFMNRLVAIDNYKRTDDPTTISPMVISGTHALDIVMWYLEKKTPVECYARSIDKVLGPLYQGIDATAGMIMFADGSVYHLNISWALPVTWPGAVYSLEVGIVGTEGVLTIDDTHRDMVLAVSKPQSEGYAPDPTRLVDFMGSYPPGDMALGELRGPMAEETVSWLNRVALGLPTQAATAAEAHRNLMLTKALDLSAKRKQPVKLPLEPPPNRMRDGLCARSVIAFPAISTCLVAVFISVFVFKLISAVRLSRLSISSFAEAVASLLFLMTASMLSLFFASVSLNVSRFAIALCTASWLAAMSASALASTSRAACIMSWLAPMSAFKVGGSPSSFSSNGVVAEMPLSDTEAMPVKPVNSRPT